MSGTFGVLGLARSWQSQDVDCRNMKDFFPFALLQVGFPRWCCRLFPLRAAVPPSSIPTSGAGVRTISGTCHPDSLLSSRGEVRDLSARKCVRCRCVGVCWAVVARWFGRSSSGLRPGRSCVLKSSREILSSLVRCHSGFSVGPFPRPVRKKPCLAALPHLTGVSRAVRLASNILT